MNKQRRKEIETLINRIEETVDNFHSEMESIQSDLESIRDDEQDYLDNIPENLQGSERYEIAETAVDNLESAVSAFEDMVCLIDVEDIVSYLNDAAE